MTAPRKRIQKLLISLDRSFIADFGVVSSEVRDFRLTNECLKKKLDFGPSGNTHGGDWVLVEL